MGIAREIVSNGSGYIIRFDGELKRRRKEEFNEIVVPLYLILIVSSLISREKGQHIFRLVNVEAIVSLQVILLVSVHLV